MPEAQVIKRGTCRSCHAWVLFVRSATSDQPMILDVQSKKRIVLGPPLTVESQNEIRVHKSPELPTAQEAIDLGVSVELRAHVVSTFVDHHVTCPQAESWRK